MNLIRITLQLFIHTTSTHAPYTLRTRSVHPLITHSLTSLAFFLFFPINISGSSVMQARSNGHHSIDGHTDIDIDASLWLEWNGLE